MSTVHKRSKFFLLLSFILVLSISGNVSIREASAQLIVNEQTTFMLGTQLQLKPTNQNYYSAINKTGVTDAQNETDARFVASFVNQADSGAILQSFQVMFYNHTNNDVAAQTLKLTYDASSPNKITVPINGSYTEVYDQVIPFPTLDEPFIVQYQFVYVLLSNTSNVLNLNSPYNFSLYAQLPLYTPPDFVIYAWWTVNAAILVHFLIGWYGNRKIKKQTNNSN